MSIQECQARIIDTLEELVDLKDEKVSRLELENKILKRNLEEAESAMKEAVIDGDDNLLINYVEGLK